MVKDMNILHCKFRKKHLNDNHLLLFLSEVKIVLVTLWLYCFPIYMSINFLFGNHTEIQKLSSALNNLNDVIVLFSFKS